MRRLAQILRFRLSIELLVPVVLIILYVLFLIALRGSIPTTEEIISHLAALYERFGYEVIFIGALLEALVLVNFFVPGSVAVAFGAIFARSGQVDLTLAVLAAFLGALSGYLFDFLLGYFGFGQVIKGVGNGKLLDKAKQKLQSSKSLTFILGFMHPNIGSFIALAAGTLKIGFLEFLIPASLSTVFWVSFWGILVFALGEVFLIILTKYIWVVVLLILSIWLLATMYGSVGKRE